MAYYSGEAQSNQPPFPSALNDVFRGGGTSLADKQDNFTASVKLGLENLIREDELNGLSHDLDQYHASNYPFDPTYRVFFQEFTVCTKHHRPPPSHGLQSSARWDQKTRKERKVGRGTTNKGTSLWGRVSNSNSN